MRFTPDNFLYMIKQLVTGANADPIEDSGTAQAADGGIWRDNVGSLGDIVNLGAHTTTSTFSTAANDPANTISVLTTAATFAAATIGHLSFFVPRDYDEASDRLVLRLNIQSTSASDVTQGVIGTPTVKPIGAAGVTGTPVTATLPFSITTYTVNGLTSNIAEIVFQGLGLKRDTIIDTMLAYSGGAPVGNLQLYGYEFSYYSTIVSYNEDDSTDAPGGTLPGFGNPLR
jgi:hypothetical protein